LPEVCGGAAEYFDPRSEEEMMAAVALVLGSTSRREELRQAGLVRAGEFSWARMAEETAEIYRRARGAITHVPHSRDALTRAN